MASASCFDCPIGRHLVDDGQSRDNHDEEDDCIFCTLGREHTSATTACVVCPAGKYQDNSTSVSLGCKLCPVNTFLKDDRRSACLHEDLASCIACPVGTQSREGASSCHVSDLSTIPVPTNVSVLRVSNRALKISWSFAEDVASAALPIVVQISKDRTFLTIDSERNDARTSDRDLNAFNLTEEVWKSVFYVRIGTVEGKRQGKWSQTTEKWTVARDCLGDDSFLNDIMSNNPGLWSCDDCPRGGYCVGEVRWHGMFPKFGFSTCPAESSVRFAACPFRAACLGGANRNLLGKYTDGDNGGKAEKDPADCDLATDSSCIVGCHGAYRNDSQLCGACKDGFSHADLSGKCDACPEPGTNLAIVLCGGLIAMACIVTYVKLALMDKGKVEVTDGIMSITLSFFQLVSLMTTFSIAWPQIFVALFAVGGAVTVLGQHLVKYVLIDLLTS